MRYLKLVEGKAQIAEIEKPVLKETGAIVKVEGCGLCGSDLVKIKEGAVDAVLGHEIVGKIVEIKSSTDFKIGDKIVMGHHFPCFDCEFCKNESFSMCKTFKTSNLYPGGFSEFILITEGHLKNTVFKIPENVDPVFASFTEPLACCVRAVKRANILHKGVSALTLGLGSIGLLMAQFVRHFGHNSFGFDINSERQKFAENFGIKFDKNLKYDVIFMTSGSSKAILTALEHIKDGGKIIVFSSIENDSGYQNNEIYYRELSIIGSYSPAPVDLKTACDLINDEKIKLNEISTVYTLNDIENAIKDTLSGKIYKAYIKI